MSYSYLVIKGWYVAGGSELADDYKFSCGNLNDAHYLGTGVIVPGNHISDYKGRGFEFWGFRSGVAEVSLLLGYDAVSHLTGRERSK